MLNRLLERSTGLAERSSVSRTLAFPISTFCRDTTLAHGRMTDDERRTLFLCFRFDDSLTDGIGVVTRNLLHIPTPCEVFGCYVFRCHFTATGGQLNSVGVIEHNKVIQTKVTGQTTCALRDLFLHAAIRDEGINRRVMNLAVPGVEPFGSDGCSDSKRVSLTKRTGSVLNHSIDLALRMSGRNRTPLTQVLQVFERELTGQTELPVEHRSHVTRVQEETVTRFPTCVVRIVL